MNIESIKGEKWQRFRDTKYFVSNFGRIIDSTTGNKISYYMHKSNADKVYWRCSINRKRFFVHNIVAEVFLDKPDYPCVVNHIDYNTLNPNLNNLEYITQKENIIHAKTKIRIQA